MRIHVHITRIVIDDIPMNAAHTSLLRASFERALADSLRRCGLSTKLCAGGSLAGLPGGSIRTGEIAHPQQLGTDLARAVHLLLSEPRPSHASVDTGSKPAKWASQPLQETYGG